MHRIHPHTFLLALLALAVTQPALAQEWHGHGDIHHFHEHDYDRWRAGSWFNGFHGGRTGWWWIVDGSWFFYPAPVYPFPDPYVPPTVVVENAPAASVAAYYYCPNPAGYYPYISQCYGPWQKVVTQTQAPQTVVVQQQGSAISAPPQAAPPAVTPTVGLRENDERKLNALAADLTRIDLNDVHVNESLKKLDQRVGTFRASLFKRDYNAMDVLKNTEDLQHRIAEARMGLKEHKAEQSTVMPSGAVGPPPSSPPSGTTVTFPSQ